METDNNYLLIYGTLLSADNEHGKYLKTNSKYIDKGSFKGLLYNLGEYPGAIYQPDSTFKVYGDIIRLDHIDVFKLLDEYEGYGEGQPQPWLYTREIVPVETTDGLIDCWVYLYNLTVKGHPQILSGRY